MGDVELLDKFMSEFARVFDDLSNADPSLLLDRQLAYAVDLLRCLSPLSDRPRFLGTCTLPSGAKCSVYMHKWLYAKRERDSFKVSLVSPKFTIDVLKDILKEQHYLIPWMVRDDIREMVKSIVPLVSELKTDFDKHTYTHHIDPPKEIFIIEENLWRRYVSVLKIEKEINATLALRIYVYYPEEKKYKWLNVPYIRDSLQTAAILIQLEDEIKALMNTMQSETSKVFEHNEKIIKEIKKVVGPRYVAVKLKGESPPLDSPWTI